MPKDYSFVPAFYNYIGFDSYEKKYNNEYNYVYHYKKTDNSICPYGNDVYCPVCNRNKCTNDDGFIISKKNK